MPGNDKIKQAIEKAKGKRAVAKKIDIEIVGAKSKALPKDVKEAMADAFGTRLDKVRLHTGGNLREVGGKVGAYVFAIGNDVYFRDAKDASDKPTLAHELAHIVQAGGGKKMPPAKSGKVYATR